MEAQTDQVLNGLSKDMFLENCEKKGWVLPGDNSFLERIFNSLFGYNNELLNTLASENVVDTQNRKETLKKLHKGLRDIPEAQRTDVQKEAFLSTEKEIDRIPYIDEADDFTDEMANFGWTAPRDLVGDMFLAAEGLPNDHPYVKQLENMRDGICSTHDGYKCTEDSEFAQLMTYDEINKARALLLESGIDTPASKNAIREMDEHLADIFQEADAQKDDFKLYTLITKMPQEAKGNLMALKDAIGENGPIEYQPIKAALDVIADPHNHSIQTLRRADDILSNELSELASSKSRNDGLYSKSMEVIKIFAPSKVERTAQAALDVDKNLLFNLDLDKFKTLADNIDKLDKAYSGHKNSNEYVAFVRAIKDCGNANSADELWEAKNRLTECAKKYLDHTGLGKASFLHQVSETRRLAAFRALDLTDQDAFTDYSTRANQKRKGPDAISHDRLEDLDGIGKSTGVRKDSVTATTFEEFEAKMGVSSKHKTGKATNSNSNSGTKRSRSFESSASELGKALEDYENSSKIMRMK